MDNSYNSLKQMVSQLVGKKCWGVIGDLGHDSLIEIQIGKKIKLSNPIKNNNLPIVLQKNKGEYSILIYSTWRIAKGDKIICPSSWEYEKGSPMYKALDKLNDLKIVSMDIIKPCFDLFIEFENNYSLSVLCDWSTKSKSYDYFIYTPDCCYAPSQGKMTVVPSN